MDTFVLQNPMPQKLECLLVDLSNKETLASMSTICSENGYHLAIISPSGFNSSSGIKISKGKIVAHGSNLDSYLVKINNELRIVPKSFIEINYRKI